MKKIITSTISVCLLISCITSLVGQVQYIQVLPMDIPFDYKKASDLGYLKASVDVNIYEKAEDDESGQIWSIDKGIYYRPARYAFFEGKLEWISYYDELDNKTNMFEFTYKDTLLANIDEFVYDSLGEAQLMHSYRYHYDRDGSLFQKVVIFAEERNFRLLYDYTYDEQDRIVREKISGAGVLQKVHSLDYFTSGRQEQLTLVEYRDDARIVRVYESMHTVVEIYKSLLSEKGNVITLQTLNNRRELQHSVSYNYLGATISKESHYGGEVMESALVKTIYYSYDTDGLLQTVIIEEGDEQMVLNYAYFTQ